MHTSALAVCYPWNVKERPEKERHGKERHGTERDETGREVKQRRRSLDSVARVEGLCEDAAILPYTAPAQVSIVLLYLVHDKAPASLYCSLDIRFD